VIAWRISNYADLHGLGGLLVGGRWHSAGQPVVYLADHAASAMLEMLVHSELPSLPPGFQLLKVEIPDHCVMQLDEAVLEADWRQHAELSQAMGDDWLASAPSAVLSVPSALVVDGCNYLLNPRHPDASFCKIVDIITAPLDPRLRSRHPPSAAAASHT